MDRYGNGEEILLEKVFNSEPRTPSFQKFTRELFTGEFHMASLMMLRR